MNKAPRRQRLIASVGGVLMAGLLVLSMARTKNAEQALEQRIANLDETQASVVTLQLTTAQYVIEAGTTILEHPSDEEHRQFQRLKEAHEALKNALAQGPHHETSLSPAEQETLDHLKQALIPYLPEESQP